MRPPENLRRLPARVAADLPGPPGPALLRLPQRGGPLPAPGRARSAAQPALGLLLRFSRQLRLLLAVESEHTSLLLIMQSERTHPFLGAFTRCGMDAGGCGRKWVHRRVRHPPRRQRDRLPFLQAATNGVRPRPEGRGRTAVRRLVVGGVGQVEPLVPVAG